MTWQIKLSGGASFDPNGTVATSYNRGALVFDRSTQTVDPATLTAANAADIACDPRLLFVSVTAPLAVETNACIAAAKRLDAIVRGGPITDVARCPDTVAAELSDLATARAAFIAAHG
jgi:hypothetical protein